MVIFNSYVKLPEGKSFWSCPFYLFVLDQLELWLNDSMTEPSRVFWTIHLGHVQIISKWHSFRPCRAQVPGEVLPWEFGDLDSGVPVNPGHFWGIQYEVMVKFGWFGILGNLHIEVKVGLICTWVFFRPFLVLWNGRRTIRPLLGTSGIRSASLKTGPESDSAPVAEWSWSATAATAAKRR